MRVGVARTMDPSELRSPFQSERYWDSHQKQDTQEQQVVDLLHGTSLAHPSRESRPSSVPVSPPQSGKSVHASSQQSGSSGCATLAWITGIASVLVLCGLYFHLSTTGESYVGMTRDQRPSPHVTIKRVHFPISASQIEQNIDQWTRRERRPRLEPSASPSADALGETLHSAFTVAYLSLHGGSSTFTHRAAPTFVIGVSSEKGGIRGAVKADPTSQLVDLLSAAAPGHAFVDVLRIPRESPCADGSDFINARIQEIASVAGTNGVAVVVVPLLPSQGIIDSSDPLQRSTGAPLLSRADDEHNPRWCHISRFHAILEDRKMFVNGVIYVFVSAVEDAADDETTPCNTALLWRGIAPPEKLMALRTRMCKPSNVLYYRLP